jgi:hypothetical protein
MARIPPSQLFSSLGQNRTGIEKQSTRIWVDTPLMTRVRRFLGLARRFKEQDRLQRSQLHLWRLPYGALLLFPFSSSTYWAMHSLLFMTAFSTLFFFSFPQHDTIQRRFEGHARGLSVDKRSLQETTHAMNGTPLSTLSSLCCFSFQKESPRWWTRDMPATLNCLERTCLRASRASPFVVSFQHLHIPYGGFSFPCLNLFDLYHNYTANASERARCYMLSVRWRCSRWEGEWWLAHGGRARGTSWL